MKIINNLRSKFWTYWYEKGYTFHKVLFVAYIGDLIITNTITAIVVYLLVK